MERPRLKEALSIPNCMCYFRILLIPLFVWRFVTAETAADYYLAGGIVALSGLTDLFDGKIARRFQMATELGKFLDPLADKLTLGALLLCMALRRPADVYKRQDEGGRLWARVFPCNGERGCAAGRGGARLWVRMLSLLCSSPRGLRGHRLSPRAAPTCGGGFPADQSRRGAPTVSPHRGGG